MPCLQAGLSQESFTSCLAVCSDCSADRFWAPLQVQLSWHGASHLVAISGRLTLAGLCAKVMAKQRHPKETPQLKVINRHGKKQP